LSSTKPSNGEQAPPNPVPLVSIGLPTYNRAKYLPSAIASVLAQDHPRIQLIVSDNASTDATADVCRPFVESGALVYVRQATNISAVANFRAALRLAEGEFYMWLGDDDELSTNYVSSCLSVLRDDPEVSLAGGMAVHHRDGVVEFREAALDLVDPSPSRRVIGYYRRVFGNSVFYGLMRRDLAARQRLDNVTGSDALFVAALAFGGKVRTVDSVSIMRGTSASDRGSDLAAAAPREGRSALTTRTPWVSVAGSVLADIGWRGTAYGPLTRPRRLGLGLIAAGVILARAAWWQAGRSANRAGRVVLRRLSTPAQYNGLRAWYRRRRAVV
jgi:hypothetical protein